MNLYSDASGSFTQWPPSRLVPSGTITIVANGLANFPGTNGRQDRLQFVVTNLDAANIIKLATPNGLIFATVFPQRNFTLPTSADFEIINPNGVPIQVEVGELYPDTGHLSPRPRPAQ